MCSSRLIKLPRFRSVSSCTFQSEFIFTQSFLHLSTSSGAVSQPVAQYIHIVLFILIVSCICLYLKILYYKNNLCSWGFNFKYNALSKLQTISNKYKCDFSYQPHTSIEYAHNASGFKPFCVEKITLNCKVHLVDIRSDFPNDWNIIQ